MINKGVYFFIIGSYLGWIIDIIFRTIAGEDKAKAGLANGPFCMLYGIGMFTLALAISKCTNNIFILFLFSAIVLTIFEYITGVLLDKAYGIELWNYSKLRFGINKYISLEFMFIWGILGVLFIKYLLPILNKIYNFLYGYQFNLVIYLILIYILIDYIYTSVKLLNSRKIMSI
jgi:uncharacterized membrane protein